MVNIDAMLFGFVPGQVTTDAIFVLRQIQEKHCAINKHLYITFVDLEREHSTGLREMYYDGL